MNRFLASALLALAAGLSPFAAQPAPAQTAPPADLPTACRGRDGWTDPAPPARIFGDTWYVGTCGITVLLVTSDQGHVLIDGGPKAAAPLVAANIEKLGFRLNDVKWILTSHEHEDHVGALAELKRLTGAKVAALDSIAPQLSAGKLRDDDPQRKIATDFPPVAVDRVLGDREDLRFGSLTLSVRSTPAHTAGSASWSWQACDVTQCRTVTYADSATAISADDYRFTDHPDQVSRVREGLKRIAALPCDVLITPHPGASDLFDRLAGRKPLGDPSACRRYGEAAMAKFDARLAQEGEAK